eukprot:5418618-Karenia_brevis.AAC.1
MYVAIARAKLTRTRTDTRVQDDDDDEDDDDDDDDDDAGIIISITLIIIIIIIREQRKGKMTRGTSPGRRMEGTQTPNGEPGREPTQKGREKVNLPPENMNGGGDEDDHEN